MKTAVFIDGMNMIFRCSFVYDQKQSLQTSRGTPTGTIYGIVRQILSLRDQYPSADLWFVWEGKGSRQERRKVYAEYKAGRENKDEDTEHAYKVAFSQINAVKQVLQDLGVHQAWKDGYEADDVIASLCEKYKDSQYNVILSSDRDLLQLVNSNTILMTPSGKAYDRDRVMEEYHGVPPEKFLLYKVFDGDSSDNIPGLFRVPRKKIAAIVKEHDDLDSIYKECGVTLTDYQRNTLTQFQEQSHINYEIMRLRQVDDYTTQEGKYNEKNLKSLCDQLEFESLRADILAHTAFGFVKLGDGTYVNLLHNPS